VEVVASLSQGRTAAAQCGLFTHKSVPVIFEPPCTIGHSVADMPSGPIWTPPPLCELKKTQLPTVPFILAVINLFFFLD
jgi:hypothetical protein